MLRQPTLFDSHAPISSEASAAGSTRSSLQVGPKIDHVGPAPALARRSRAQEKSSDARRAADVLSRALDGLDTSFAFRANTPGTPTADISGPSSGGSSAIAGLQSSLANRLAARTDFCGSPEYEVHWTESTTILGPPICRLAASRRRISASGCSGWPSPASRNADGGPNPDGNTGKRFTLQTAATLSAWPTPNTNERGPDGRESKDARGAGGIDLQSTALLASAWDSPTATDHEGSGLRSDGRPKLPGQARLAAWVSPSSTDGSRGSLPPRPTDTGVPLDQQAAMVTPSPWATASSRDWKDSPGMATTGINPDGTERSRVDTLPRQAQLALGVDTKSSTSKTAKRGVLNPALSLWLMGFPSGWLMVAPATTPRGGKSSKGSGTRSSRSLRRSS